MDARPPKTGKRDQGLADRWVRYSCSRPWRIAVATILGGLILLPQALSLRIDTDLRRLLPDGAAEVRQMDRVINAFGDYRYFTILIESECPESSVRFADHLAGRLGRDPEIRAILYQNPVDFLRRNAFYRLAPDEIRSLRDSLFQKRVERSPLHLGLGPKTETEPKFTGEAKRRFADLQKIPPYHTAEEGRILALQVRYRDPDCTLSQVRIWHARLTREIDSLRKEGRTENLKIRIGGSLKTKLNEVEMIRGDTLVSTFLSMALVLAVLLIFLRSWTAIGLLLIPLLTGLVATFAITAWKIGFLGVMSAMLFLALLGMGIDHGVHLLGAYLRARRAGLSVEDALRDSLTGTGGAVILSAITTTGGFFFMGFADFKGYSQLGFISGWAMTLITAFYFLSLPALICLAERSGRLSTRCPVFLPDSFWNRLTSLFSRVRTRRPLLLLGGGILFLLGGFSLTRLTFNDDFEALKGDYPEAREIAERQKAVYTESLTPGAVFLAEDEDELDAIVCELEARRADGRHPTIGRIFSLRSLIPRDAPERRALLREAAELVTPAVLRGCTDPELRLMLESLRDCAAEDPPSRDNLPEELDLFLMPRDGSNLHPVYVFPAIDRKKGRAAMAFADELRGITVSGRVHEPTGDTLILAETLRCALRQGRWILLLTGLVISGLLSLEFRGFRRALPVLGALLAGFALMSLFLWVGHIAFNFFNLILLAAVIGMGVDSAIHIYARWIRERRADPGGSPAVRTLRAVGGGVTACVLTTTAGYFGMVLSRHPGLRSIGLLTVTGLLACYAAALLIFPLFLAAFEDRNDKKSRETSP